MRGVLTLSCKGWSYGGRKVRVFAIKEPWRDVWDPWDLVAIHIACVCLFVCVEQKRFRYKLDKTG